MKPATPTAQTTSADQFAHLPLTALVTSLTNPRKSFREDKLAELADSIRASGVHQPILVRPLPGSRLAETFAPPAHNPNISFGANLDRKKARPTHEIVSGERRYRASQQAGKDTIPALVRNLTDDQVLEIQIIENLQRDDLTELEEAEGYDALMRHNAINADQVGSKIGKSRSYVYGRLKLLDLCMECKDALRTGTIDASRALLVARIPDGKLQLKALQFATEGYGAHDAPSLRQFQAWLRSNVMLDLAKAPFDIKLASLAPSAGPCTTCPKRTGANPDLFSEVQGADLCTDLPCYQGKLQAAKDLARTDFKKRGIKIVEGDEAEELHMYSDRFDGYIRLNQKREDTTSGQPATLHDLLGDKGRKAVGVVAIEHPDTQELITYAPDEATEKWLEAQGLVLPAGAPKPDKTKSPAAVIEQLTKVRAHKITQAETDAVDKALQSAIDDAPDKQVESLLSDTWLRAYHAITGNHPQRGLATAKRPALLRALLLDMLAETIGPEQWDDEEDRGAKQPAIDELARVADIDLEAIRSTAEVEATKDIDKQIADQQALLKRQKAPATPAAPATKPKAQPRKSKLTATEAAAGIADAMQGLATEPQPSGLAVGGRVTVNTVDSLRFSVARFANKCGAVTHIDDDGITVKLDGRNGVNAGTRIFDVSELVPA